MRLVQLPQLPQRKPCTYERNKAGDCDNDCDV
jgi:hypothetical protein